ncbi:hypothetical protein K402DRAFT_174019 [Aulographum hederae CBS 113979]|uniref:PHD-type domain-containing protein n=1 Tax=Aulographum hederae CBS 113979 TaxID=1176131 RepID=A0A6G1HDM0_9PEZI|nr:hypothetical protein K402DRAFT_174019 [Aulographum hederae CBS 113979]
MQESAEGVGEHHHTRRVQCTEQVGQLDLHGPNEVEAEASRELVEETADRDCLETHQSQNAERDGSEETERPMTEENGQKKQKHAPKAIRQETLIDSSQHKPRQLSILSQDSVSARPDSHVRRASHGRSTATKEFSGSVLNETVVRMFRVGDTRSSRRGNECSNPMCDLKPKRVAAGRKKMEKVWEDPIVQCSGWILQRKCSVTCKQAFHFECLETRVPQAIQDDGTCEYLWYCPDCTRAMEILPGEDAPQTHDEKEMNLGWSILRREHSSHKVSPCKVCGLVVRSDTSIFICPQCGSLEHNVCTDHLRVTTKNGTRVHQCVVCTEAAAHRTRSEPVEEVAQNRRKPSIQDIVQKEPDGGIMLHEEIEEEDSGSENDGLPAHMEVLCLGCGKTIHGADPTTFCANEACTQAGPWHINCAQQDWEVENCRENMKGLRDNTLVCGDCSRAQKEKQRHRSRAQEQDESGEDDDDNADGSYQGDGSSDGEDNSSEEEDEPEELAKPHNKDDRRRQSNTTTMKPGSKDKEPLGRDEKQHGQCDMLNMATDGEERELEMSSHSPQVNVMENLEDATAGNCEDIGMKKLATHKGTKRSASISSLPGRKKARGEYEKPLLLQVGMECIS